MDAHYSRSVQNNRDVKQLIQTMSTYYPWVKIVDSVKGKPTWVPPSVVLQCLSTERLSVKNGLHQQD